MITHSIINKESNYIPPCVKRRPTTAINCNIFMETAITISSAAAQKYFTNKVREPDLLIKFGNNLYT